MNFEHELVGLLTTLPPFYRKRTNRIPPALSVRSARTPGYNRVTEDKETVVTKDLAPLRQNAVYMSKSP